MELGETNCVSHTDADLSNNLLLPILTRDDINVDLENLSALSPFDFGIDWDDIPYIDCKENFPLNLSEQFCKLYNNQMLFNESISKFISRLNKNDLLVLFSDTPPLQSYPHYQYKVESLGKIY